MADYRRNYDDGPRRHERDWSDRAGDEVRSWFGDEKARQRRGNDERDDRFPYGGDRNGGHDEWRSQSYPENHQDDRGSRWENPRDDRDRGYYPAQNFGSYRTDDRPYHDRYRTERYSGQNDRDRYRDDHAGHGPGGVGRVRYSHGMGVDDYYRAAEEQRQDYQRWSAQSPGAEFDDDDRYNNGPYNAPSFARERGGYWRQYETRSPYAGRGPKDYRRSDERVREEVCDCMTDDPMLDASEISVQVSDGVVTLNGTVPSRDQKRRAEDVAERISGVKDVTNQLRVSREANGHAHTATRPVTQSETGTPSKSSSTTT
jgi:osmotically-inducible protein OsmY